jgi:hypothetical protein
MTMVYDVLTRKTNENKKDIRTVLQKRVWCVLVEEEMQYLYI